MKTVIDLSVPKSWQELPDKELRFVFRLLNGSYTLAQVKTRCLLRWAGMKVVRQEGALFIMRYKKQVFPISALQITEAISNLEWLGDFPVYPVRLSRIGFHRAVNADLQNVSFEDFLTLDNLYQGYLQTQKENLLHDMALILYQARFIRLTKEEATCIFYWFTSLSRDTSLRSSRISLASPRLAGRMLPYPTSNCRITSIHKFAHLQVATSRRNAMSYAWTAGVRSLSWTQKLKIMTSFRNKLRNNF